MSNNNASNNLIIAQRAVKQLRLEASIRRIKVGLSDVRRKTELTSVNLLLNGGVRLSLSDSTGAKCFNITLLFTALLNHHKPTFSALLASAKVNLVV